MTDITNTNSAATPIDPVAQAVRDIAEGRIVVVADDESRENEGDLICAARYATPKNIAFMATHGRGLICTPMTAELAQRLDLPPMCVSNTDNHHTAFTVSIDHVTTSTGISARDRSVTAMACIDPDAKPGDFRRPGHMFPLVARPDGVLERNGHTEATVDLARLAGLEPCGLCCEMMKSDGTMMRRDDLEAFAAEHGLTYITIAQLQQYRRTHEFPHTVRRVAQVNLPTEYGRFTMLGYESDDGGEHVALVMGDDILAAAAGGTGAVADPVLCRIHSQCLTGDVFGSKRCDCGPQLHEAMRRIAERGRGVVLYLSQEGRGIGLLNKLRTYELQEQGFDTLDANLELGFPADAREYETAAAILEDLGIRSIDLMTNNPDKISQLEAAGIVIDSRVPIVIPPNEFDANYLSTKQHRMGHLLGALTNTAKEN
ncbi:bifunctional 3,4-dihydroxy-2-butanone-4-phosphate synthase/GTP cyclohydrolase II [Bifidobacterium sp. 82T24]|uniref:bifunctional 3,4-dihydroxy-2-butanone-4-phosphate synthase/GTP cyclohydrolase II n=1 Tax=Bifidobacterium pluvialisilvae TaxID=2834436 RepID=UPI001C594DB6|nr:bifunctional 3,4-dihydroxy-2-butanone-4-phosphate synthase/GTP cyclohydrolase II [Bifidobacterium pluvialisilvae]MBW3088533.1 bifunctional 3,4-dihydroxy-2-butanone-4-phosphate synthase/GTP cyclohydrolase II [Bifidobacterium pluvialisilvae]